MGPLAEEAAEAELLAANSTSIRCKSS